MINNDLGINIDKFETLKQNKEIHIDWHGAIFKEVK